MKSIIQTLLEQLEPRIAPASLAGTDYEAITVGSPQLLKAGEGLSTSADGTGSLLLKVEKGQMLVFTTDLNGNNRFDPNEITGIAAGDGLRFTSFVDINGDVVTNLQANGRLSDSDGDRSNGLDGKLLLNSRIESMTLRSVTAADLGSGNPVADRIALSSYSVHGFIYAGNGLGGGGGTGLIIDTAGISDQVAKFSGLNVDRQISDVVPNVGGIKTGTAASGSVYSFGYNPADGSQAVGYGGALADFVPQIGQAGGDVLGIRVGAGASDATADASSAEYTIGFVVTGDGGIGARGGNIQDVALKGDTGGLRIVAGDGGDGIDGGAGGSITNLSDEGSYNSVVEMRAGDGGEGFLGRAGAAGQFNFGTMITNGQVAMGLGSGGVGLTQGAAGTGLLSGKIELSEGAGGADIAITVASSWRPDEVIAPVVADFNNDGFADVLFVAQNPDQLGLRFGPDIGIVDDSPTVYFNSPIYGSPGDRSSGLVIADFNNDGLLDFATAASWENASDGLRVFLNDGTWFDKASPESTEQSGNYVDTYVHNALPYLPSEFLVGGFEQHRRGFAVTDLVSGDFNNDGNTDLAYLMQGLARVPEVDNPNRTNLVVLEGLGDGRFFANFGYDRTTDSRLNQPFDVVYSGANGEADGWSEVTIKSSVSVAGDASTSRIVMAQDAANRFDVADYSTTVGRLAISPLASGGYYAGWVGTPEPPDFTSGASIRDFTILDFGQDGFWDMIAINGSDALTTFQFDASAASQLDFVTGEKLTGDVNLFPSSRGITLYAVASGDFDGDLTTTEIAILGDSLDGWFFEYVQLDSLEVDTQANVRSLDSERTLAPAQSAVAFAPFDLTDGDGTILGAQGLVILGKRTANDPELPSIMRTPVGDSLLLVKNLDLYAGAGGDSRLGAGGNGGGLGAGSLEYEVDPETGLAIVTNAALEIIQPAAGVDQAPVVFQGGLGGNGFTQGGRGGALSGLRAVFVGDAEDLEAVHVLFAGHGGSSLLGAGGAGGGLANFFTQRGTEFVTGNGGAGMTGGAGGSIQPNSPAGQSSNLSRIFSAETGRGGDGITAGGQGGQITAFVSEGISTSMIFSTGDGGDAVAGRAGNAGAVIRSSPLVTNNLLVGPLTILTGAGGNGLIGGSGGNISEFVNASTAFSTPSLVNLVAGNGGSGVTGNGGAGGSVTDVTASGTGVGVVDPGESPQQFNRVIAGDGGDSFGAAGGAGGVINRVDLTANSSAAAVAAGLGGDGLTRGGVGGSVLNSLVDSAASNDAAKVIVFAGSGGNAYAALATSSNVGLSGSSPSILALRAFGGVAGIAGNGGSITALTQPKTVEAAVDLVAGNGGSLMNYGSPADAKTNVGTGGSVTNIKLAGDAGRIASNVAIQSYGPDFVQTTLRDAPATQLTSAVGNVGVVVGEAGRVRGNLPGGDGGAKTGAVTNFSATNIMSMVAGSVDRIAAIRVISGINVDGGILGAYKNTPIPHDASAPLYLAANGVTRLDTPAVGGRLMDGAIITQKNSSGLLGARIFTL
jgi:hypothetical protein